jgi:hypothetical protein
MIVSPISRSLAAGTTASKVQPQVRPGSPPRRHVYGVQGLPSNFLLAKYKVSSQSVSKKGECWRGAQQLDTSIVADGPGVNIS